MKAESTVRLTKKMAVLKLIQQIKDGRNIYFVVAMKF